MSEFRAVLGGRPTPRFDSEADCAACPGRWVYDEVYGWVHGPGSRPECVAPSPTTGTVLIC